MNLSLAIEIIEAWKLNSEKQKDYNVEHIKGMQEGESIAYGSVLDLLNKVQRELELENEI